MPSPGTHFPSGAVDGFQKLLLSSSDFSRLFISGNNISAKASGI